MTSEEFQKIISDIPNQPGIYKYFNADSVLLYVGKAKNLRKRISSYFTKTSTNYKTQKLVVSIHHIEFTIVDTEQDAFLLENSLIKTFKPKYNILAKDDKTFPFIVIKNEPFSRVFFTRKKINDGSEYFGPYTSVGKVRELLDIIKQYIPLRTCKLLLTTNNIQRKKFKVCLEYHLGNCKAPCEGLQTLEEYNEWLQQVRNILKGNLTPVFQHLKKEMALKAANMEFEQAAIIKSKLEDFKKYQAKSVIVSKHLTNMDIFSMLREKDVAYVNYLMVQNGTTVQTHTIQLNIPLEQDDEEVLSFAIARIREDFNSTSDEIVVPFKIKYPDGSLKITIPKAGEKKQLLNLSLKNVNYFKQEIQKRKILHLDGKTNSEKKKVLYELQQYLHLQQLPTHIECFDNSNFQGSFPVSAMVCFKDGIPSKNDYRKFNVKTVQGINDFATMKEVVYRRYKRLLDEQANLPQLIIIDGGKGQLSAAMESITALKLNNQITVIGLAKNEEQIFFHKDTEPITLPWNINSLKLIRFIRDEVHRFGITFHRNKRAKGTFKNELENIKGIGNQTVLLLLKTFKSVKNIQSKSVEELSKIVGKNRSTIIFNHFNNQ